MRFRLRTLVLIIAGSTGPIYAGAEGWKFSCLPQIVLLWTLCVAVPLSLMIIMDPMMKSDVAKDRVIGLFGALAIIGYLFSILASMIIIGMARPWFR
jgi:hypothetical protein